MCRVSTFFTVWLLDRFAYMVIPACLAGWASELPDVAVGIHSENSASHGFVMLYALDCPYILFLACSLLNQAQALLGGAVLLSRRKHDVGEPEKYGDA